MQSIDVKKQKERAELEAAIERYRANGGRVTVVPTGQGAESYDGKKARVKALLYPPKRTRAEAQAELGRRHFKPGRDSRRRIENEPKDPTAPRKRRKKGGDDGRA